MTGYLGAADCDLTIIYGVLVFAPYSGTSKSLTLSELSEDKLFNDFAENDTAAGYPDRGLVQQGVWRYWGGTLKLRL